MNFLSRRRQTVAASLPAEATRLSKVWTTVLVSLLLVVGTIGLNLPWPVVGVLFALPWVLYGTESVWRHAQYNGYLILAGATLIEFAFAVAYSVRLSNSTGYGATATTGGGGLAHFETVVFAYSIAIWLVCIVLLKAFRNNRWLRAAVVITSANALEHAYVFGLYATDRSLYLRGGGLVPSPLPRAYLHFVVALVIVALLLMAFWTQTREVDPGVGKAVRNLVDRATWHRVRRSFGKHGVRPYAGWVSGLLLGTVMLIPGAASVNAAAGIRCVDVAASIGLQFTNSYGPVVATDQLGALMQRDIGNGVAVGDYDRDGYLDIYVLGQNGHPSRLFRNVAGPNGSRRFVDVTKPAGLAGQQGLSRVAFFADLTGNGLLDLVVINDRDPAGQLPPSKIYRNNGDGTFSDVTQASGFDPTGYIVSGAALADYNGDGLPDIYISYWTNNRGRSVDSPAGPPPDQFPGFNRLYRNLGNFQFKDVTLESGLGRLSLDSFTPIFTDFTGGGYPDIYLPMDYGEGDRFLKNIGGQFRDASSEFGVGHIGNDMGVAVDLSRTGMLDLYVTNITDPSHNVGVNPGNALLVSQRNESGSIRFSDHAAELGVLDTAWGWGAAFVDVSLNGRPDLYVVQGAKHLAESSPALRYGRAYLFLNDGHGNFVLSHGTGCDVPGDQRSLVVLDYNRDGAPDFLVTQVNGPVLLLHNATTPRGNWLTVSCDGKGARCLGAKIYVTSGGHTTGQVLLGGGSFLAGPPLEAYFGLGTAGHADSVVVVWTNGKRLVLHNIAANRMLKIVAPPVSERDHLGK